MIAPLRCTRVGYLRSFLIPNPGMQMPAVGCTQLQNAGAILQQAFRDADPMAVIASQFQRWKSPQDPLRVPGIPEIAGAMRFMGNGYAKRLFHLQSRAVKIFCLGNAPRIRTRMAVDKQRILIETFLNLRLQRKQVFRDCSRRDELVAEYLGNPCQLFLLQCSMEEASVGQIE